MEIKFLNKNKEDIVLSKRGKLAVSRRVKKVIFILLGILLFSSVFSAVAFARYQQGCTYQRAITSELLINTSDRDICPNVLDLKKISQIAINALNPNFLSGIEVNGDFDLVASEFKIDETCDDPLNPVCLVKSSGDELAQTDAGYTNLLLVGLDTRANGGSLNTDTIMVITLNNNNNEILFTSFPRDLLVDYERINGGKVQYKINGVYSIDGDVGLNYTVEQIIGQPIHYYAYIDLGLFIEIIDELGTIKINLDDPFGDLYPCDEVPSGVPCSSNFENYGYFTYPAGLNEFDSLDALIYSRSRQLSSDYERATRQQNLLKAVLKNVLESEGSIKDKVNNYVGLYNLFRGEVNTNIELKDAGAMFSLLENLNSEAGQMVTDPNLGNSYARFVQDLGVVEGAGYSIQFVDRTYEDFQNYRRIILENLELFSEKPKILIRKQVDFTDENLSLLNLLATEQFIELRVENVNTIEETRIYDFSEGDKNKSYSKLIELFPFLSERDPELDNMRKSEFGEDILIHLGI